MSRLGGGPLDEERAARAALVRAHEPGDPELAAAVVQLGASELLRRWGSGAEVHAVAPTGQAHLVDPTGRVRCRLRDVRGDDELTAGAALGARFVVPGDPDWPDRMDDLLDVARTERAGPPIGLWVVGPGSLRDVEDRGVAVVGSRAATAYGVAVASELAADLATDGRVVVSGAAYGIDAAAHRGALAAEGATVAVLACGVDVPYPRGHTALLQRIRETGLVVSECPPGAPPHRIRFLARNRLIAALTRATVVVEAAARSGALSTARWAQDLERPLLGVPGPVTSALSVGVHDLLKDGAQLATGAGDVRSALSLELVDTAPVPASTAQVRTFDGLSRTATSVHEHLPTRGTAGLDALMAATGLRLAHCLQGLHELAGAGLAEADGSRWRLTSAARRGGA